MTGRRKKVRQRSGLKPGNTIRHEVTEKAVEIERAGAPAEDPFASFTEWASEEDEKAYGKV